MRSNEAERSRVRRFRRAFAAVTVGVVVACGGSVGGPKVGGESHFLTRCDGSCGGGLSCISGVCTRGCVVSESSCADLATNAQCTDQSVEPGAVAVCDVACVGNAECASVGQGYQCTEGFCRAGQPMTPSGKSCRVLYAEYPSGSDLPTSNGCDTCVCQDGEVICSGAEIPCASGVPVAECPRGEIEHTIDPIEVLASRFEGDILVLKVRYGGGCGRHDYGLCYGPEFLESYPVQTRLRLLHDAHEDLCNALLETTLRFDLSNLANRYKSAYQAEGGLISTPYGLYAFGELPCNERLQAADAQIELAHDFARKDCITDDDCRVTSAKLSCGSLGCAYPVNVSDVEALSSWARAMDTPVCGADFASACPEGVRLCGTSDAFVACREGECVITN